MTPTEPVITGPKIACPSGHAGRQIPVQVFSRTNREVCPKFLELVLIFTD